MSSLVTTTPAVLSIVTLPQERDQILPQLAHSLSQSVCVCVCEKKKSENESRSSAVWMFFLLVFVESVKVFLWTQWKQGTAEGVAVINDNKAPCGLEKFAKAGAHLGQNGGGCPPPVARRSPVSLCLPPPLFLVHPPPYFCPSLPLFYFSSSYFLFLCLPCLCSRIQLL